DEPRNARVEFPPVADRLHGAVDHADPLAGLRRRRPLPRDRRIPAADSPVRWGGTGAGMKRITLLGATGSIGLRTLDLVSSFSEEFEVAGLAARGSCPWTPSTARSFSAWRATTAPTSTGSC